MGSSGSNMASSRRCRATSPLPACSSTLVGPKASVVWRGREPALTVIPNLLATGLVAMAFSLLVMVWAGWFLERKNGAAILAALALAQLVVGGGLAPLFLALPAAAVLDLWVAVFGNTPTLVSNLPPLMFGLLFLTVVAAFACDLVRLAGSRASDDRAPAAANTGDAPPG